MKKILLFIGGAMFLSTSVSFGQTTQIRRCGAQQVHEFMIAQDPSWKQRLEDQKASLEPAAQAYLQMVSEGSLNKTTTTSAIPVIFHIVLNWHLSVVLPV